MAARKTVTYVCEVCGTEVTVNSEGLNTLSPIYCCGISLSGSAGSKRKPAKKAGAKSTAKKKAASKPAAKIRTQTTPRRAAKKSSPQKRAKK